MAVASAGPYANHLHISTRQIYTPATPHHSIFSTSQTLFLMPNSIKGNSLSVTRKNIPSSKNESKQILKIHQHVVNIRAREWCLPFLQDTMYTSVCLCVCAQYRVHVVYLACPSTGAPDAQFTQKYLPIHSSVTCY